MRGLIETLVIVILLGILIGVILVFFLPTVSTWARGLSASFASFLGGIQVGFLSFIDNVVEQLNNFLIAITAGSIAYVFIYSVYHLKGYGWWGLAIAGAITGVFGAMLYSQFYTPLKKALLDFHSSMRNMFQAIKTYLNPKYIVYSGGKISDIDSFKFFTKYVFTHYVRQDLKSFGIVESVKIENLTKDNISNSMEEVSSEMVKGLYMLSFSGCGDKIKGKLSYYAYFGANLPVGVASNDRYTCIVYLPANFTAQDVLGDCSNVNIPTSLDVDSPCYDGKNDVNVNLDLIIEIDTLDYDTIEYKDENNQDHCVFLIKKFKITGVKMGDTSLNFNPFFEFPMNVYYPRVVTNYGKLYGGELLLKSYVKSLGIDRVVVVGIKCETS